MEKQNTAYKTSKCQPEGPYYKVPKNPDWEDDLWYYDIFHPSYELNKMKINCERSKEKK